MQMTECHRYPKMKPKILAVALTTIALGVAAIAHAHNAICSCFENDNGTITCEGGFSDGGKAAGVPLRVLDQPARCWSKA